MINIVKLCFILWIAYSIATFLVTYPEEYLLPDTPKDLYDVIEIPVWICIIIYVLLLLVNPIMYLYKFKLWLKDNLL